MSSPLNHHIIQAWKDAAADLGIRLVAPCLWTNSTGDSVAFEAYLPDFGSKNGAYLIDIEREIGGERPEAFHSKLGNRYCAYNRQLFIETLDDWGWFGPDPLKPAWYTGRSWG